MVAIIDYDAGNIMSVEKAVRHLGSQLVISRDPEVIRGSDHIILPGVGAFGDAMDKIRHYDLEEVIRDSVGRGIPFLGICLGLHLIFSESQESPGAEGLGLLPGKVLKIPARPGLKIPHMGWNSLEVKEGARLFRGIPDRNPYVYFVHSYYLQAEEEKDVCAITSYGTEIHAAVEHDNIFACQFHPEKSSAVGLKILENFLNI